MKRFCLLLMLALALVGCGESQARQPVPLPQPTSKTASTGTANNVGVAVQSGAWLVTLERLQKLTSAATEGTGMFRTPTPGYLFLLLTLTMKNTGTSAASVSSQRQFSLRDINGNLYDELYSNGSAEPGGVVAPGQHIKGSLVYEAPADTHVYILQFQPGIDISQIIQWSLTL